MKQICVVDECPKPTRTGKNKFCDSHYRKHLKYGDATYVYVKDSQTSTTKFWQKVEFTMYCWNWTGALNHKGYGNFSNRRKLFGSTYAHRIAYELFFDRPADDKVIDHICRNRKCVNPAHLRQVSYAENQQNTSRFSKNLSGYRGVTERNYLPKNADFKHWRVRLFDSRNQEHESCYPCYELHVAAYYAHKNRKELFTYYKG